MKGAPLSLRARALRWLAQREHSRDELRRKLTRAAIQGAAQGPAPGGADAAPDEVPVEAAAEAAGHDIEHLLDDLEAGGWLSAPRFIESRVHARAGRFGDRRIAHELAQHGLTLDANTAQTLKATEESRARAVWQRRFGARGLGAAGGAAVAGDADDAVPGAAAPAHETGPSAGLMAEQARQARFLLARGFSTDTVRRVVRHPAGAPDDDPDG